MMKLLRLSTPQKLAINVVKQKNQLQLTKMFPNFQYSQLINERKDLTGKERLKDLNSKAIGAGDQRDKTEGHSK